MNIAVIGAGSSGLVTLKYLLDAFPTDTITCFEKGQSVRGCWGDQRPDFISTSTRYTTQFSCFRQSGVEVSPEKDYSEFFRGAEFGDYLDAFAEQFALRQHIQFGTQLCQIEQVPDGWRLWLEHNGESAVQTFDAVFLCTGLVNQKVPIESTAIPVAEDPEAVRNSTVVVVGGGESAADIANHLAKPEHNNTVYLSLRSGIRVSPRYHPIRGVPSDFLRNRLLLSFNKDVRNWLGERFVTFRIRFNRLLERWFPHQDEETTPTEQAAARRRHWDLKLKERAKDGLFNVFHNKSDDFLAAVGEERLAIIGPAVDDGWTEYYDFDQQSQMEIKPDVLVRATGYRSMLPDISNGSIHLRDFYHGCVHTSRSNLFLIGFARPIIGSIPSITEMQTRYAIAVLSGAVALPDDIHQTQADQWQALREEYPAIDVNNVYPVEQYPYCDVLAREMGIMPTLRQLKSLQTWLQVNLAPASTTHYLDSYFDAESIKAQRVHTPPVLIAILVLLRLGGLPIRWVQSMKAG